MPGPADATEAGAGPRPSGTEPLPDAAPRFRILGPLEVWEAGQRVAIGGPQQRALLALLLLNANRVVSIDRLVEQMWGEQPPPTAHRLLHGCVAQLRRVLQTGPAGAVRQPLVTRRPGYVLQVEPGELDADRFEELVAAAGPAATERSAAGLLRAAATLRQALSLWRGPVLEDITLDACQAAAARLEERRLAVLERRVDVDLLLGRHADLVGELQIPVRAHPLRERLWAQLMLALYGADRRADALAAFRELRRTLVEQLGVEPSAMLQRLERAILSDADALEVYWQEVGAPVADPDGAPPARVVRETDRAAAGSADGTAAAGDARSGAARATVPAQLPAAISSFTGRTRHLHRLDSLLAGDGGPPATMVISAISGTAGVGKTALAVHWAHRVRDRFGDGQLYVDLRGHAPTPPVRPIEALASLLPALGVPVEQVPVELDQAAGLYRTLLADKRVLVLLDNARSAEQVRPLLPGSPGCLVLVTSRDWLGGLVARDDACDLTLDVLTSPEAHALLGRILGRERVEAEPEATAHLAKLCAFLPLALRIAAANLTLHADRTIAHYVATLAAGDRLGSLGVEGDEHAAVRAAFDLSYAAQPAAARRLFRLLGLTPGPDITADAAAALTGAPRDRTAVLLDRLSAANLLTQPAPGRYACHDLLRLYAAERAAAEDSAADRDAATRRLFGWYLLSTDAAVRQVYPGKLRLPLPASESPPIQTFDDRSQALGWLDAERSRLVAVVRHAARHGPRPVAWLLTDALRAYFWSHGYPVDWLATAQAGLAAAQQEGDLRGQAAAELSLADAYQRGGEPRRAIEHYTRMLALTEQTGWLEGQAAALGSIGVVHWRSGRLPEAADHLTRALAIDRQTGRLGGQAISLTDLGGVLWSSGRLSEAADHIAEALEIDRQIGSRSGEASQLNNLGEIHHALGRLDQALDHLTRALALNREIGNGGNETDTLRLTADVHRDAGRLTAALESAAAALALARDAGERRFEADALNTLATVQHRLGQHAAAVDGHEQALRLARETDNRYAELVALLGLSATHQHLDQHDRALVLAAHALALARRGGLRMLEGQAHTALAGIHLDLDQHREATEQAEQALGLHRRTGHRLGLARTLVLLGRASAAGGDTGTAVGHWRQALALFTEIGVPEAGQVRTLLLRAAAGRTDARS